MPALFLTLLLAFIERRQEVRGIPPEHRVVSLDSLNIAIGFSALSTAALIHLAMSTAILTLEDLGTLIYATVIMWAGFTRIRLGEWVMRRLIKGSPSGNTPTT
ncbi:MAG: hypothetical protein WDZ56_01325 [Candidatus Paceibacterota bacterium]